MSSDEPRSGPVARTLASGLCAALVCIWPASTLAKDPAISYAMECQGCHLADGSGGLDNIPALTDTVAKFLTVPGGREYLVQVPGVAFSALTDQQTVDVLNWMLQKFGPADLARRYPRYTLEEVAALRPQPLADVAANRAALLQLIAEQESSAPNPGVAAP